jgi:hypothetical protein
MRRRSELERAPIRSERAQHNEWARRRERIPAAFCHADVHERASYGHLLFGDVVCTCQCRYTIMSNAVAAYTRSRLETQKSWCVNVSIYFRREHFKKRRLNVIPILDFCFKEFHQQTENRVTVGRLHEIALQHHPRLFVFHDSAIRMTVLIIPDLVIRAVQELQLPKDDSAWSAGLLGALRRDQLIIHQARPAVQVAGIARITGIKAVIAVDDKFLPVGLFMPVSVRDRLPNTDLILHKSSLALQTTINRLVSKDDLVGALSAIETEHSIFHSERLNQDAPVSSICAGDGADGPHNVSSCPCIYHPGSSCAPRGIV